MPDVNELLARAQDLLTQILHTGDGIKGRQFREYVEGVTSLVLDEVVKTLTTMPEPESAEDATHALWALRQLEASLRTCSKETADKAGELEQYVARVLTASPQCRTGDLVLTVRAKPKAGDPARKRREFPELYDGLCDVLGIKQEFRDMEVIRLFHPGLEKLTDYLVENGKEVPYVLPDAPHNVPSVQIRKTNE